MIVKPAYKRLETDEEFRERIVKLYPWAWMQGSAGVVLDDQAWHNWKMQRRILEIFP